MLGNPNFAALIESSARAHRAVQIPSKESLLDVLVFQALSGFSWKKTVALTIFSSQENFLHL